MSHHFCWNYDEFEKTLHVWENFFKELSECDVEPHTFFDGVGLQDPATMQPRIIENVKYLGLLWQP